MSRRVCVRGLIVRDGKLFAQKLKRKNGTINSFWCTPGGGVDPLESLHDALTRELIEETGVAPEIGRLVLIQQFGDPANTNHEEDEQLEFFFLVKNVDDYTSIDLAATTHGQLEVAEYEFVDPLAVEIRPTILSTSEFMTALADPHANVLFYDELPR